MIGLLNCGQCTSFPSPHFGCPRVAPKGTSEVCEYFKQVTVKHKDCNSCKHEPYHSSKTACAKCLENRYMNGPGATVVFTEWEPKEVTINSEEWARQNEVEKVTSAIETQGTGMKYDSGKTRLGILLREFAGTLCGIGEVLSFGANKYVEGSWMHVPDAQRRYEDAFLRHLLAIKNGEWLDQESGLPHIDHALTNLMFLRHFYMEDKQ